MIQLLSSALDGQLSVWDTRWTRPFMVLQEGSKRDGIVKNKPFVEYGFVYQVGIDGKTRAWCLRTGKKVLEGNGQADGSRSVYSQSIVSWNSHLFISKGERIETWG